jgi:uncharacterized protein YwgA
MNTKSIVTVRRLIDELGGVEGRTRLQKIVHLLGERFPNEFRQRFTLHYFGPFSRELAGEMDFLISAKLVAEDCPVDGTEAPYRYRVASGAAGKRIEEASGSKTPEWIDFARRLNKQDKLTLEALSTLVFLRNRPARKDDSLRQEFGRLKPHLAHKFDSAVTLADELVPRPSR